MDTETPGETKLTLAKVLKLRKRLSGLLARTQQEISLYNSHLENQPDVPDVAGLIKRREDLVAAIVKLKLVQYEANRDLIERLYNLAEKKGKVQWLQTLNTRTGQQMTPNYSQPANPLYTNIIAHIKKSDVDAEVKKLESEIDALQDEIDQYNNTKRVRLDNSILVLVG